MEDEVFHGYYGKNYVMTNCLVLLEAVSYTHLGAIVTAEEHSIYGGLGSAVAEVLAEHCPGPMERIGAVDFAESGDYGQLMEKYGYGPESIAQRCRAVMRRKQDNGTGRLPERTLRPFDMP